MTRKRNKPKNRKGAYWQSADMNVNYYTFYYELLQQLFCSSMKWTGMPSEIDERFVELTLYNNGAGLFFMDEDYDKYFFTQFAPSGEINMYNNPISYQAYAANGFNRRMSIEDCVPIYNNYLRRPESHNVAMYARQLADIDRTMDVNLLSQKMPILATVPEEQRLTVQNMMKQWTGNEPIIIGQQGIIDTSNIQYLTSGAPYIVDKLIQAHDSIWARAMTFIGIDNASISKAERVQSAEVTANNGQIEACRLIRLNNRRDACKKINSKYGLKMWCDMNYDVSSENLKTVTLIAPAPEPGGFGHGNGEHDGGEEGEE